MNIALTCTGDRQICLELSKQWMISQTIQPDKWLIIDDGKTNMPDRILSSFPTYASYIRRQPLKSDPLHTLNINLLEAMKHISTDDSIIFWEDDEYYAPEYFATLKSKLKEGFQAVGICRSRYYNLPSLHYFTNGNIDHSSLAQTAITGDMIAILPSLIVGDPFIDMRIWKSIHGKADLKWNIKPNNFCNRTIGDKGYLFDDSRLLGNFLYAGMKGMPGRKGIGAGHHPRMGAFDKDKKILKQWTGNAFPVYEKIYQALIRGGIH